jgi:hypothetical protein
MPLPLPDATPQKDPARAVRGRFCLLAVLALFVLTGLVFPFPVGGRLWSELFDLAHAPIFCVLLLIVAGLLDPSSIGLSTQAFRIRSVQSGELMFLAGTCLMLGCLGEFLQAFVGRSPSMKDLAANAAGVASGTLWVFCQRRQGIRRVLFGGFAFLTLVLALVRPVSGIYAAIQQNAEFPLLASFERANELQIWEAVNARVDRTAEWASDGQYALQVDIFPGEFSGVVMTWPVPDWRGYEWLSCEVQTPGPETVALTLKLYDKEHITNGFGPADRFEATIEVSPGELQTLRFRLSDVADAPELRPMNLRQIAGVELFVVQPRQAVTLFVDNIRLLGSQQAGIPIDIVP